MNIRVPADIFLLNPAHPAADLPIAKRQETGRLVFENVADGHSRFTPLACYQKHNDLSSLPRRGGVKAACFDNRAYLR